MQLRIVCMAAPRANRDVSRALRSLMRSFIATIDATRGKTPTRRPVHSCPPRLKQAMSSRQLCTRYRRAQASGTPRCDSSVRDASAWPAVRSSRARFWRARGGLCRRRVPWVVTPSRSRATVLWVSPEPAPAAAARRAGRHPAQARLPFQAWRAPRSRSGPPVPPVATYPSA